MLSQAKMVARKAIESLYDSTCNIIEYHEVQNENKSTGFKEIVVVENQPCKLSFETLSTVNNQEDNASEKIISTKLFISPDILINPGSKISITYKDTTTDYKFSGKPAIYDTHQEIMLEIFDRWA